MKKIALLLLAAMLLTALAACKEEPAAHKAQTTLGSGFYTLCEGKEVSLRTDDEKIFVYDASGDTLLQELSFAAVDPALAKDNFAVYDVNGDGTLDMFYPGHHSERGTQYMLWLYSAAREEFVECAGFRQLLDPHVDSDSHVVSVRTPKAYGCCLEQQYTFSGYGIVTGSTLLRDGDKAALTYAAARGMNVEGATVEQGHFKLNDNKSISLFTVKAADGSFLCRFGLDVGAEHVYYSTEETGEMFVVE